jgi:alpha-tubulin suppressor-like RCC1 family protein
MPTRIPNLEALQVAAGGEHTVVLDLDNNIWTFGDNFSGQLGLGLNSSKQFVPTQISNFKAKQIAAGNKHTVVIDWENNVWTFGNNRVGQLGLGDNNYTYSIKSINLEMKLYLFNEKYKLGDEIRLIQSKV